MVLLEMNGEEEEDEIVDEIRWKQAHSSVLAEGG
jgi:hypothetical protein